MINAEATFENSWYAVRVRPKNEFRVSELLRQKIGIKSRVPSQKVWKLKNGEKIVKTRPLLASYVFILSDLGKIDWKQFYSIGGILGFVKSGKKPASIPETQLNDIEKFVLSESPVHEIDYSKLNNGDRVEVVEGPLKGAVGNYLKLSEKTGKFVVRLDLFKRALVTELSEGFVRPL